MPHREEAVSSALFPPRAAPRLPAPLALRAFRFLWLGAVLCAPTQFFATAQEQAAPASEIVRIANGRLQTGFDSRDGRLREFVDLKTGHNHVGNATGALWELECQKASGAETVSPAQAGAFRCEEVPGTHRALRLAWDKFNLADAPRLCVEVVVHLDTNAPLSQWQLIVGGLNGRVLTKVCFPRVSDIAQQADERLAVPVWMGQLTSEPRRIFSGANGTGHRQAWEYPGRLALQCLAFYRNHGPGLYVACDDTAAYRKNFAVFGDGHGALGCEIVHLPERWDKPTDRFALPYQVVLGAFEGDWVTAAERYRAWATNQVWATESRLRRGAMPAWVLNTGMWVWNRGYSTNVLAPALALQAKLGLPVSVLWHWWHGCSYDTGFPEYLPPREGEEAFTAALAAAHKEDMHALVYMNQRLWGMTTASWTNEGAAQSAVKGSDGKVHPEVYNTFTQAPCASMCMGTGFWRNKYANLAERAVRELGVDGIYMDQACTSLACYDPTHGHPLGGGTYWMNGFRLLAADIRQRVGSLRSHDLQLPAKSPSLLPTQAPVALAGEGCGEPWLPHLDLMLSLQVSRERYAAPDGWETIPFFHAVYHDCAITFGNYSSLTMPPFDDLWPAKFAPKEPLKLLDKKFSRQFYLEQARAFVWGQQPTVANFLPSHLEQRPEETDYAMRLAKVRSRGTKYLVYGTFLRPPELSAPEATLDISRLSIYAGQQGGLTAFQKRCPLALAGAWRAPDGDAAIALASLADEPLSLALDWKAMDDYLPRRGRICRTDEAGSKQIGKIGNPTPKLKVDLPPRGACLVEFIGR